MAAAYLKPSKSEKVFNVFNISLLTLFTITALYPIIHVVMASISDSNALIQHSGILLTPVGDASLSAYKAVAQNPNILNGYMNTLFVLFVGVILQLIMTSLGAYFFSRRNVMWRDLLMFLVVFTMFFEGGMIPFYLTVRALKLTNTRWSLIVPFLVSAYNLIIMRTSFAAIPVSLEESAKLDGASHWTVLFRIILPLSKPVIAVMILYYGVGAWNGWFWASVFLRQRELYPLQLILREILIANDVDSMTQGASLADQEAIGESIKYATIVVATLPILCVYPFLQKYFVKGVMIGAVKG
ncbi:carbohydrate ABC transporter permease [Vallitalea okinawensis]|uniref:carbohydrate ABC transporter permease n=1 Tax=Vallitalea okinawensis TaxID=2078660 RepID=UPI000CFB69F9|nr:carbohydrate ABC transporter permease [Vallitalea okinawensis]